MDRKSIKVTVVTAVLAILAGVVVPNAHAGELKPFKGRSYQTSRTDLSEVPDDPYFQEIVDKLGPPLFSLEVTAADHNNVGGRCIQMFLEITYVTFEEGSLVGRFFSKGVTVAADGDTIQWTMEAVAPNLLDDTVGVATTTIITGGTGRFEGASGSTLGTTEGSFPYPNTYEGVISTVGSLMRNK